MRKHSVRKWLHAVLDLLPVLILPVFAIYEINHDHNEPISVDVSQNEVVNFNQLMSDTYVANITSLYGSGCINRSYDDDYIYFETSLDTGYIAGISSFYNTEPNHVYVERFVCSSTSDIYVTGFKKARTVVQSNDYALVNGDTYCSTLFKDGNGANQTFVFNFKGSAVGNEVKILRSGYQVFDLTLMFGEGNEPSLIDFNTMYPLVYYSYNTGTKQLIKDVSTVTYADTDVGSQMIYSLYKPVVNYFNFNNVFNFGAIYDWFQLNMFNGNAPMVAFIVWNIIIYEFIMDILFLVYSVFMFLIDFAEGTLEKFTGWCTRG